MSFSVNTLTSGLVYILVCLGMNGADQLCDQEGWSEVVFQYVICKGDAECIKCCMTMEVDKTWQEECLRKT